MKIAVWDIETSPLIVPVFDIWDQTISHEHILEETNIICACWKEVGRASVGSVRVDIKNPRDDYQLCQDLQHALEDYDVLVAHNGNSFDVKILNARLLKHGMDPMPNMSYVDTKLVAKNKFRMPSARLDYLGRYLGLGRKKRTSMKLWLDVLNGKKQALDYMVKYCAQDVRLDEKVYLKMRPFMTNHPNHRLFDPDMNTCPKCGKGPLTISKRRMTAKGFKDQYQCQSCGGYCTGAVVKSGRTKIA